MGGWGDRPGNRPSGGRTAFQDGRRGVSRVGERLTERSCPPLPCRMRSSRRGASLSDTGRWRTSETRSPAAEAVMRTVRVLAAGEGSQTRGDCSRAQDDGACVCPARQGEVADGPVVAEGHAGATAQGADALVETTPRDRLLVHERPLRRTNVFGPEPCRGLAAGPGREGHARRREALGVGGEVAHRPVVEVPLPSGCHHRLLARADPVVGAHQYPPRGSLLASRREGHPRGACCQKETGGSQDRATASGARWAGSDPSCVAMRWT
jgi:hypothetical protein